MASLLLDLPTELLGHILWYLDLQDLRSCQLVHPALHSAIKDSTILKYLVALKTAGMEDNCLHIPTRTSERLNALRRREAGWACLSFDSHHTVQAKPKLSWPIVLDGGVLFLLDNLQMNIHYIVLPSGPGSPETEWECFHSESRVLKFGLAVAEHDLVAVAVAGTSINAEIEILLLQVSTALPHPLAQDPRIVIANTSYQSCTVSVDISRSNIIILVNNYADSSADRVFVYDWTLGVLKMTISAPHNSYEGVLFLSADRILLPNRVSNTLDIWTITGPARTTPRTYPDTVLEFLPFRGDTILMGLSCCSTPIPTIHGTPHSKRPFHESAEDAIIYLRAQAQSFHTTPLEEPIILSVFVHRRSLLHVCTDHTGTNRVPWDAWGPPVVRVLPTDVVPPQWLISTAGERYVTLSGDSEIVALDFNTKRAGELKEKGEGGEGILDDEDLCAWKETAPSRFVHGSLQEPVVSELPYAYYRRKTVGPFNSVMMDGERVLGIRGSPNHGWAISEIEVMRLGSD